MKTPLNMPSSGEPGTRKAVKGRGVVEFGCNGKPVKIWTRYGDTAPNPWLNSPFPEANYFVGASRAQRAKGVRLLHIYRTDHAGVTSCVEVPKIQVYESDKCVRRWRKEKSAPKGYPGKPYDRGHLIARRFGAGMEAINLVTMPNSVNQPHGSAAASAQGFHAIADLSDRYIDTESNLKGTLVYRGEVILPNYWRLEKELEEFAQRGQHEGLQVGLVLEPVTINGKTDVIYSKIWLGDKVIKYVVDCNVT